MIEMLNRYDKYLKFGSEKHASMDGSVVEFSPATREARVRFPVHATFFFQFHVFIECARRSSTNKSHLHH